jgi:hypothetical protein
MGHEIRERGFSFCRCQEAACEGAAVTFRLSMSRLEYNVLLRKAIANASSLSEKLVPAMWEHIRRFMEEGGPHLPQPFEPLANLEAPLDWWHSVSATGPFGAGYMKRWDEQPGYMWFMHLALPVTLPMFLLWGTGNWLSYKTAVKVDWPAEVKQVIGVASASRPC